MGEPYCHDDTSAWCDFAVLPRAIGLGVGIAVGALIGVAVVEATAHRQAGPQWENVPLDRIRLQDPGASGGRRGAGGRSTEEPGQGAMKRSTYSLMIAAMSAVPR